MDIRTSLWASWVVEQVLPKGESNPDEAIRTAAFFAGYVVELKRGLSLQY